MINYQPPTYHPGIAAPQRQMGSLATMTAGDWALLLGSTVVGGAGINGLISNFTGRRPKPNAISIMLNLVLSGVGLTLFIDKGGKAISA